MVERVARDHSDEGWPDGPYAWGKVIIDGTPWPVTLELLGKPGERLWSYCRFATGHPFGQLVEADGFRFCVVVHPPYATSRSQDELFIDW